LKLDLEREIWSWGLGLPFQVREGEEGEQGRDILR
jgi:hypothetical protein